MTMKTQFEEASKRRDYRVEEEVYAYLQSFLKDNERKIESAKKRLTLTQETPEMEEKVMALYTCICCTHVVVCTYNDVQIVVLYSIRLSCFVFFPG